MAYTMLFLLIWLVWIHKHKLMSAIFGIVSIDRTPINQSYLSQLQQSLAHRGKDGYKLWSEETAGLGQMMLFTTPESKLEKLPLEYHDWVITADARIDNRKELFDKLSIKPSEQSTTTDALLIMKAFEKWSSDCPKYLVGDFAFAIWDKIKKQLFCAKDHVGVRQFYYFKNAHYFVFSTEIQAITKLDFVPRQLNSEKIFDYVFFHNSTEEQRSHTYIQGIEKIRPSHSIIVSNGIINQVKYWNPTPKSDAQWNDPIACALALKEQIEQATNDRIRTDYPIGINLSGGLDSSTIACLASRKLALSGKKLFSASSVLPLSHGELKDERIDIEAVLKQESNIVPFYVTAQNVKMFDNLNAKFDRAYCPLNAFHYMDEALASTLHDEANARIVLSGFGGDNTATNHGNTVIKELTKGGDYKKAFLLSQQRGHTYNKATWRIVLHDMVLPLLPDAIYTMLKKKSKQPNFSFDSIPVSKDLLDEVTLQRVTQKGQRIYKKTPQNLYEIIWGDGVRWFEELDWDVLYASYQQEASYPLIDKRIIEFLFTIPLEQFQMGGWSRGLIRNAMDGVLPPPIQWKTKKAPFSPDYPARIIKDKAFIFDSIRKEEITYSGLVPYIDIPKIRKTIDTIRSPSNWNEFDINSLSIINTGIMALKFVQWQCDD